jgi:N-formylglutamate amidohydrolase
MRDAAHACVRLEDRHIDHVAACVAEATGAGLLVAHAPRALIDLNRAPDDIDWDMFSLPSGAPVDLPRAPGRARTGLGLVPRRLPGFGEIWKRRQDGGEVAERIAAVHSPYHACLAASLEAMRRRWGTVLLVDLHSMPPLPARAGQPRPQVVLGDRFGASCDGRLVAAACASLEQARRPLAHNRPYAGGYVLGRHAAPARGVHALQLEIDRSEYLDSRLDGLGEGVPTLIADLSRLVRALAGEVAAIGANARNRWPEAAE